MHNNTNAPWTTPTRGCLLGPRGKSTSSRLEAPGCWGCRRALLSHAAGNPRCGAQGATAAHAPMWGVLCVCVCVYSVLCGKVCVTQTETRQTKQRGTERSMQVVSLFVCPPTAFSSHVATHKLFVCLSADGIQLSRGNPYTCSQECHRFHTALPAPAAQQQHAT